MSRKIQTRTQKVKEFRRYACDLIKRQLFAISFWSPRNKLQNELWIIYDYQEWLVAVPKIFICKFKIYFNFCARFDSSRHAISFQKYLFSFATILITVLSPSTATRVNDNNDYLATKLVTKWCLCRPDRIEHKCSAQCLVPIIDTEMMGYIIISFFRRIPRELVIRTNNSEVIEAQSVNVESLSNFRNAMWPNSGLDEKNEMSYNLLSFHWVQI